MRITRRQFGTAAVTGLTATTLARAALAQGGPLKMTMGSPMPASHSASTFMADAVEAIRRETGGAIDIQFIPSSALGSEPDMHRQLRAGAIEFLTTSCSSLQTIVPVAGMPGVAYAFKGYPELWAALDGDLGQRIRAELEKAGIIAFGCLDNGFRNVTTGTKPIDTVADLAGLKIRVPPSPLLTSLFRTLGASPVTITIGELYTALQTKLADGMENSLVQFEALKIYEVQKFCSLTAHSWDGLWVAANSKVWAGLGGDVKAVIRRHFDDATTKQHQDFARRDRELEAELSAKGLRFNRPERGQFREVLAKAGYYTDWKSKFGAAAWSDLEKYTGPLGA